MAEQRALGRNHGKAAAAPVLTGEPVLLGRKQRKEQYIGLNPTFMHQEQWPPPYWKPDYRTGLRISQNSSHR
jgi:hypothetical protein